MSAHTPETIEAVDAFVTTTLAKHVRPSSLVLAIAQLKQHVKSVDDDALENAAQMIEAWATDFAATHPEHAKEK